MSKFVRRLLGCLIVPGLLLAISTAGSAATNGQQLYEKRCAACHKLPDPAQPPAIGWEQQVEMMAPLARLKDRQKQEVLEYLVAHSQQATMDASLEEDRLLFVEKCSLCHSLDRILLSELRGDALGHVVERMQSRSGTDWLSDSEVDRVLAYLSRVPREPRPSTTLNGGETPVEIFAARCSACHTLERVFSKLGEDADTADFWSHTVSRMRSKAPQWMSESEASQILDFLQADVSL